ncbi:MAG: murein biosynthesis integral membrane protein MurJ [Corallincola sp.]|nr:murein biosynthesis integral membrane protein MurJ [Corallincola sp.]
MSRSLVRSGMVVSIMTFLSRVLGLVRDVVIANLLGAGTASDVFFFANRIPNFLRRLFAEGAFAQAFVPVLAEEKERNGLDGVRLLMARASGTLGTLITIVTLLAVVGSPVVAAIFGTGWFVDWWQGGPDAAKFELASLLLKITFPYLWFVTLTALAGAVLNTLGKFGVASFTPVLLNVVMIAAALWLAPQMESPELALAIGVFVGGLAQLLFQLPFLYKARVLVKPVWAWRDPSVVKIRTLMIPALFGVSVSQINLLLDTVIASFLQSGSISWLYYADRLLEFPLGLFGIAIATVILPSLSARHANKHGQAFTQTLDWALRSVAFVGVPAMFGLVILAQPLMMVLFMRGSFDAEDARMASHALMAYGSGLLFFMSIKILAPGYYARQDTKTPVRYGITAMVANMAFNLVLVGPFSYVGLALATALSGALNAFLLYRGLAKAGVYHINRESALVLLRMVAAAVVMTAAVWWLMGDSSDWLARTTFERSLWLGWLLAAAIAIYLLAAALFGLRPRHLRPAVVEPPQAPL